MPKINPTDRAKFHSYVQDAERSHENLSFLMENLNEHIEMDYSVESLAKCEGVFWRCVSEGMPSELSDLDHFAQLLGQYLGQCIVHHTGAKWTQSEDQNPMFAQPCIDSFGGQAWDRVYPVHTALHLQSLPREKPSFPGVHERRVFATKLEKALAIHNTHQTST